MQCKVNTQKILGAHGRQAADETWRSFFLRAFCGVFDHLLQRGEIFEIAAATGWRDAADGLRAVAVVAFHHLDQKGFLKYLQVAADEAKNQEAMAETIENNVRKLIIDEQPINPKYYEKMSELLDALIAQRKQEAWDYQEYLKKIVALTRKAANPALGQAYPKAMNTPAKRSLYDNLDKNEALATAVDNAVRTSRQDDWKGNRFKIKKVEHAIKAALNGDEPLAKQVLELVKQQDEY